MPQPLVTIITPAYNRASYLDETITSVLDQDYPNLEYLVIDDGSTDDSVEVIQKYANRLTLITQANMGETATVNKGFALARGEIIGVINSDDPLYPGAVRRIVETMLADPELLVVYPDWDMIDQDGKVIAAMKTYDYDYLDMLRWHHCMPGPGTFFRRSFVEKLGGRDPAFRWVADYELWLRGGLLGKFARLPEPLATFRVHPGSASESQKGALMAMEHIRLIDKIYALPDLPPAVKRIKREAYSSAYYIGALVSGEPALPIKRKYFALAFLHAPFKLMTEYRERLPILAFLILPDSLRALVEPIKDRLGPWLAARQRARGVVAGNLPARTPPK